MGSIHELRIVTRRLGVWSDWLVALDPDVPPPRSRRRLRFLLRGLSRMRDCQVHGILLGHVPKRIQPAARVILRRLRAEESALSRRVRRRCRFAAGWFCRDIPRRMEPLVPVLAGIESRSPSLRWIRHLSCLVKRRVPDRGSEEPAAWHRWRRAIRHLRFVLEMLGASPGNPSDTRGLQQILKPLGTIQDFDSLAKYLRQIQGAGFRDHPEVGLLLRWVESRRDAGIRRLDPHAASWRRKGASKKPVSTGRGGA